MKDFRRVAIMGAGAMGVLLGAVLTESGIPVELIDADGRQVAALRENGAVVTGTRELTVPVKAVSTGEMEGVYDLVFLMVKQTRSREALASLLPHLGEESLVCTLQNGLPEGAVAEAVGERRTLGCAVTWAATALAPGRTCSTAVTDSWHCSLGRADGTKDEAGRRVKQVLELMCPTDLSDNLTGIRWSKLLVNTSLSGVSAALDCTFGGLLADEKASRLMQYAARECVRTAEALGVRLEPLGKHEDFPREADFASEEERLRKLNLFYRMLGSAENPGRSSMLQDLEHGRTTEVDYICGAVCAGARRAGVPTPCCDRVVDIIHRAQRGGTVPAPGGFDDLILIP